jgi:hypothetical protein
LSGKYRTMASDPILRFSVGDMQIDTQRQNESICIQHPREVELEGPPKERATTDLPIHLIHPPFCADFAFLPDRTVIDLLVNLSAAISHLGRQEFL